MTPEETIDKRIQDNKAEALKKLKEIPIIEVVCKRVGISRSTFYRWKKDDEGFREAVDEALYQGKHLINDMAESQLISAIKEKNMTAIIFWLKNNHKNYGTKVELSGRIKTDGQLTPEQEELIKKALTLSGIVQDEENAEK